VTPLHACLLFSSALFCVGLVAALSRSNTILVLLGIELMLNAANLNFIAFWRFNPSVTAASPATGVIFVLFSIAVAAAEAAVGLALVIAIYRHQKNIRLQEANRLKG
jgi:NADH-quinone oxidoreductase subunit K